MPQANVGEVSNLVALQTWYAAECNGDWEHSYGVVIETLDNPGWSVEIDLEETQLACRARAVVETRSSDLDWLRIEITDAKFIGAGDPMKLGHIIAAFIEFKTSVED